MSQDVLAFDPTARFESGKWTGEGEAVLKSQQNGRMLLTIEDEDGDEVVAVSLRPDFLDALVSARVQANAA